MSLPYNQRTTIKKQPVSERLVKFLITLVTDTRSNYSGENWHLDTKTVGPETCNQGGVIHIN